MVCGFERLLAKQTCSKLGDLESEKICTLHFVFFFTIHAKICADMSSTKTQCVSNLKYTTNFYVNDVRNFAKTIEAAIGTCDFFLAVNVMKTRSEVKQNYETSSDIQGWQTATNLILEKGNLFLRLCAYEQSA